MSNTRELSEENDFEKPFRDKLSDLEEASPLNWRAMESMLDREQRISRRWYALTALLLLLGSTGGFIAGYWTNNSQYSQQVIASRESGFTTVEKVPLNTSHNWPAADTCMDSDLCPAEAENGAERLSKGLSRETDIQDRHGAHTENRSQASNKPRLSTHQGSRKRMLPKEKLSLTPSIDATNIPFLPATERHTNLLQGQMPDQIAPGNGDSIVSKTQVVQQVDEVKEADSVVTVTEEKQSEPGKWTFQVAAGGNYLFKKIDPAEDFYYLTKLANKNMASWRKVGYQLSVSFRREISPRTTILTALSYSRFQERTAYNYYDVISDSIEVKNIANNAIEVNTYFRTRSNKVLNTVNTLSIGLGVVQKINILRHTYAVLAEVNLHKKMRSTNLTNIDAHRFVTNPAWLSIKAGVEKTVILNHRWNMVITPYVTQSLQSIYSSNSVYELKPLQVGIDIGLRLPLRKMQ